MRVFLLIISLIAVPALGAEADPLALGELQQRVEALEKRSSVRWSGVIQADARHYFGDLLKPQNNELLLRRARLQADAELDPRLALRLQGEFAGASASLVDAYADLKLGAGWTLRLGRFKTPLSLERWRSDPSRDSVELGFSAGLVTDRDQGALLEWSDPRGVALLQGGVVNGGQDGDSPRNDTDDDKDAVGRVFFHPLRLIDAPAFKDLGIGWAASGGHRAGLNALPSYRSPGQATVFSYNSGTQFDGQTWRVVPQAYYYGGPLGLLFELAKSEFQALRSGTDKVGSTFLHHDAFQVQGLYVLTGEDASFKGVKLGPGSGAWGSLALLGRYEELRFDSETFDRTGAPRFASLLSSISRASSWSAGLSWQALANARFVLHWTDTRFTDGAAAGGKQADREAEQVLFARAQFTY